MSESSVSGKRVYVGISGGVDSSVALFLLKQQGYNVTGVYLRTWQPEWMECTWRDERRDAMRVCAYLGVPFREYDVSEQYKNRVAEYMINEYRSGRTPNPDVMCNREIKFGEFFEWAMKQGAEYLATGHYARTENGQLFRGRDQSKDQSYFLWSLSTDILSRTLFPLGSLEKTHVRTIAKKAGLPTASKKDSQGICFIGDIGMKEFLSHYIPPQHGEVLDTRGEVVGYHDGALFFTLGQRHGFTITKKTPDDSVLYVVRKDIEKNTITVSSDREESSRQDGILVLHDVILRDELEEKEYQVEFRYHGKPYPCQIIARCGNTMRLQVETKDHIAEGQSCVMYDGELCIGGGIVE